jgi:hypothetical protein
MGKHHKYKRRKYRFLAQPTGLAFAPTGCGPISKLINPNVSGTPPPAGTAFAAGPGKTLTNVHVQLIFWGAWWNANPLATQVSNAVANLLAGPYMSYLDQYGIGRGNVRGTTFAADSEPGTFSYKDVSNLILNLLDDDRLPEPDADWPIVYAVIMPANSAFKGDSSIEPVPIPVGQVSIVTGSNSQVIWHDFDLGDVDNDPAYFFWTGNDGTLDYITTVLSHELVELASDPNGGDGVRQVGCTGGSCQIGDVATVCQGWCDYVRGVKAQGYWSIQDANGVLPKFYAVRRTLLAKGISIGGKIPRPNPSMNAWITGLL